MAHQTPAKQLFELLVTKDFDPECLDAVGKPSPDPAETEVFSFDYTAESGNDYGTVVIMLADDNDMQVYFGDNLGKGMEGEDKKQWFDFLYSLKHFATKNLMSFSPKNLNRLRYSMQGQAAIKEGLFESWTGTRTQSWNGVATEARLMIKHKRPLGENDARFRYVESLFIETAEGERYKLPFTKLSGGRAMVELVRNGGRPYDARGQHITEMVTELNVLSRFRRANHGKIFEGDTKDLVEQTNAYYESAQKTIKSLSHIRGYTAYFESWNPDVITEEEAVVEGLKHLFVTQSLDSRIEDALPLLARIQQQGNAMKEANIFEAWIDNLAEGTWATPDTPEKQQQLIDLLSKEFPVGADATNATEQLYDLIGDDELFDQLEALAEQDPDADCRQVVMDRMDMLSNDPDIQAVVAKLQIDPAATMNPAEPTDAGMSAPQDQAQVPAEPAADEEDPNVPEVPTLEETNLEDILRIAGVPAKERSAPDYEPEVKEGKDEQLNEFLPLLAAVGRGLGAVAGAVGRGLATTGIRAGAEMHSDDAEETDEGVKGTIAGGLAGAVSTKTPGGAITGAKLGSALQNKLAETDLEDVESIGGDSSDELMADVMTNQQGTDVNEEGLPEEKLCNMTEAGESCPVHGVEECWANSSSDSTPLAGKYGHSGKMQAVADKSDFLTRLKELSGMMRSDKI